MPIEFHPDAVINFDSRARLFLTRMQPHAGGAPVKQFTPDIHASHTFSSNEIIFKNGFSQLDASGAEVGRYIRDENMTIGLEGPDYQDFVRLIEAVQRTAACRELVSVRRLTEAAFDWFLETRKATTYLGFAEYVANVCSPEIRDYEVAVPIALLSVEEAFPVGRTMIRPITRDVLDDWFRPRQSMELTDDQRSSLEEDVRRKRNRLQGYAAAFVTVRAERFRAQEIALKEADAAAGLLRFFSLASYRSRVPCFCTPLGKENIEQFNAILLVDGIPESWNQGIIQNVCSPWTLSTEKINRMRQDALDALTEIYRNPTTDLKRKIVDAVLLFSRVSISKDLPDKLVLLLASLESLFLRNDSEPIQQNLADRLALLTGTDLAERLDIVSTTKKVYGLRSRFLHHAQQTDDFEMMDKFMTFAARGMLQMISAREQFSTLDELLVKLDERKLTY